MNELQTPGSGGMPDASPHAAGRAHQDQPLFPTTPVHSVGSAQSVRRTRFNWIDSTWLENTRKILGVTTPKTTRVISIGPAHHDDLRHRVLCRVETEPDRFVEFYAMSLSRSLPSARNTRYMRVSAIELTALKFSPRNVHVMVTVLRTPFPLNTEFYSHVHTGSFL